MRVNIPSKYENNNVNISRTLFLLQNESRGFNKDFTNIVVVQRTRQMGL